MKRYFTNRVHTLRLERGLSQTELAKLVGVSRYTISRLELGLHNPSLKLACDLGKVFGESLENIFQCID